jgi:hypothetical protein
MAKIILNLGNDEEAVIKAIKKQGATKGIFITKELAIKLSMSISLDVINGSTPEQLVSLINRKLLKL